MPAARIAARTAGALTAALAPIFAAAAPGDSDCVARMSSVASARMLACLAELERGGAAKAISAVEAVSAVLAGADETTDPLVVAAALDVLRAAGPEARPAAEVVSGLLSYRHPLYRDRDKLLVVRLRAYALAIVAEVGTPPSAVPALIDVLVYADEQSPVLELAAAARAAAALGPAGRSFVPFLLEAIGLARSNEKISLERFAPDFPASEATTVQLEAVRAIAAVATPEDREALAVLTALAARPEGPHERRLIAAATDAVRRIEEQGGEPGLPSPGGLR